MKPYGEWLVTLNKLSKDRFIGVGPSYPENLQLINISGEKMELVADAPSDPEPHYAEIIPARLVNPLEVFPRERNDHPCATWSHADTGIERNGNEVTVRMTAVRSRFTPDIIEVNEGDHVTIHVTNIDQEPDITHGLGISLYDIAIGVDPGQTKTVSFVADKPGVYTFYCTDFWGRRRGLFRQPPPLPAAPLRARPRRHPQRRPLPRPKSSSHPTAHLRWPRRWPRSRTVVRYASARECIKGPSSSTGA